MPDVNGRQTHWQVLTALAAVLAPVAAVLWLGLTLSADCAPFHLALVKIIFTIAVVLTGLAGVRWSTASGITLLGEAALIVVWVALKLDDYSPYGALRTLFLLAVPVGISGVIFVLAGGMRAGTWPPRNRREP
ncbi:MAG: hypothetical protein GF405_09785 [Candidatus Eisenbacteria bacterium]|nr:hypothetical protein [Candidatus Eisenbacteria bacterium]